MKNRHNILANAWTGDPLILNGSELVLSAGRYELLKTWGNVLFSDIESDQSQAHAMHEVALLCYANTAMIVALRKMTREDRHKSVMDFMLDWEEQLPAVIEGLVERITSVRLSGAESEDTGKQERQVQTHTG
jgi:hypothetical protein